MALLKDRVIVLLPATVFHNTDLIVPKVKSCSTASQAVDATATALLLGVTRRFIFEKDPCCVGLLRAVHVRSVSEALLHCINARHASKRADQSGANSNVALRVPSRT